MHRCPPRLTLIALPALLMFGCTRYEYDIVRPPELARHVGTKSWVPLTTDDVEYRLRTADNRLVILAYNRAGAPLKLLGPDSAAVDPRGESHPLQSRTIVPGSYIRLILPPPRPQVRAYGPTFGVGVGVGYGRWHGGRYRDGFGYGGYDDLETRYYTVYDPNDRTYYNWPGGTELQLLLTYEREGGARFRHHFAFHKRRM